MTADPPPPSLLVNERGGHVAILTQAEDSGAWERSEVAHHGRWPAWSPNGRLVVRSTIVPAGDTGQSVIATVGRDGADGPILDEGTPGVLAVIAPNVPHYALWAPTSDAVSYVAVTEQGLSLFLSTLDGSIKRHRIAIGAPLFHSWSPDGRHIALHAGTDVALFDRTTLALTEVAHGAIGFRTPRFSPDGSAFLYAMPASDGVALVAHELSGPARQIGQFRGGLAFSWAGPSEVLVAVSRAGDGSGFNELWLLDTGTGDRQGLAGGSFAACWCAPAGDRVAILVPTHSGDGRFTLQARDRDGQLLAATEPFLLSDDARVAVSFFDQYELSHPMWAADGSAFVICGRVGTDAVSSSWGDSAGDYVLYWQARRGAPLEAVAPGINASFPPAPVNSG